MWRVACGLWLMMLCFLYIVAGGAKNNVKGTLYSISADEAAHYRRVILFATVDADVVDSCSRREHNSCAKRSWFAAAAAQDVAAGPLPVTLGSCCIASGKLRQTPNQRALLQACDCKRKKRNLQLVIHSGYALWAVNSPWQSHASIAHHTGHHKGGRDAPGCSHRIRCNRVRHDRRSRRRRM